MNQVVLGDVVMTLLFNGNNKAEKVIVENLTIASKELSEEQIRKLDVEDIIRNHLYDIAGASGSLAGFRSALQNGGDVILPRRDLYWRKRLATVMPTFTIDMADIDVSPDGPTILLA